MPSVPKPSAPAPRVAAVVASHKMYDAMPECLSGLLTTVERPEDLIFVDNGSGGELTEWARRDYPGITVLTREENGHYCGGFNEGMRYAIDRAYDYVAVINADSVVGNSDFLRQLMMRMEESPDVAFLGPQVQSDREGTLQNTVDHFPSFFRAALVWLPYRIFPCNTSRLCNDEREVEFLNGVCVLCRCAALKEFGLLDETFGGYVEDADWGWRAKQAGWRRMFTPIPSVIHEMEPYGYAHHSPKVFLLKRNTVYWYLKVGRRCEAHAYAVAALGLAWLRRILAKSPEERHAKACFIKELRNEYRSLFDAAKSGQTVVQFPRAAFIRLLAVDC